MAMPPDAIPISQIPQDSVSVNKMPSDAIPISQMQGNSGIDFGQVAGEFGKGLVNPSPGENPAISAGMRSLNNIQDQGTTQLLNQMPNPTPKGSVGRKIQEFGVKGLANLVGGFSQEPLQNAVMGAGKSLANSVQAPINYIKNAETAVGSKITPNTVEAIISRLKGMDPEALKAIGISDESNQIAQTVGKRVGLTELPSKPVADSYYENVIKSAPEDIKIPTSNLQQAIDNPYNKLQSSRVMNQLKDITSRSNLDENGVMQSTPISKVEYSDLRGTLNNLDPRGEDPAVQAIKQALDADAEQAIPDLSKAKGTFQVSRELSKASNYIDNPKLGQNTQTLLEKSQNPKNTQTQDYLKQLLGDKAEPILKDLAKNRTQQNIVGTGKKIAGIGLGTGLIDYLLHRIAGKGVMDLIKGK